MSLTCSADLLYTSGNSHYLEQYLHDWPWKSLCDLDHSRSSVLVPHERPWMSSVLRPRQHSIGYMGDGFYRSKDPTNNIKVLKEMLQRKTTQTNKETLYTHNTNYILTRSVSEILPILGVPKFRNFRMIFGTKSVFLCYLTVKTLKANFRVVIFKKFKTSNSKYSNWITVHQCHRQTDGRLTIAQPCSAEHRAVKNVKRNVK